MHVYEYRYSVVNVLVVNAMESQLTFTALRPDDSDDRVLVPILQYGELVNYTIPSFPVVSVRLRRITYQGYLSDDRLKVVDGFIRDDCSLWEHTYPTQIVVGLHPSKACLVEVGIQKL